MLENKLNDEVDYGLDELRTEVKSGLASTRKSVYAAVAFFGLLAVASSCGNNQKWNEFYNRLDAQSQQIETMQQRGFYITDPCKQQRAENNYEVTPC